MKLRPCIAIAALLLSAEAGAQNLIPNSGFSDLFMLDGWDPAPDTTWSSIDVHELANSGSARVVRDISTGFGIDSDCLPAVAGHRYVFAVQTLWLDAESTLDGRVQIRVEFHDTGDCSTAGLYVDGSTVRTEPNAWQEIGGFHVAPAGTEAAIVTLWGWRDPGTGTFVAYFDDAELVDLPEPDAALAAASVCATLGAIGARARWRRVTVRRTEDPAR